MQWTPEHAQWAEQHFDISSTTRSPAHKAEAYRGHLQRTAAATYQYAWANDDISALTASNLLKRYAEKYSGILEMPSYSEAGVPGLLNGRKVEGESWQEGVGVYSMGCVPEGVSMRKGGVAAVEAAAGMCSSPGLASSALTEPSYSSSSCGSHTHTATALHSSISSQEYGPGYGGGSYLHTTYGSQAASAPALPSPLHSSGLLQPPPPPSHPTLVPAYNGGSPNISGYNYPPAGYPSQSAVGPGYSPGGAPPPPSSYLPSGIAAPTPLPPSSSLPGYPYQSHNLGPIAPTPLNGSSANSLKRKAFYMTGQGEMDSTYGNFGGYGQARDSAESPMYRVAADSSVSAAGGGSGFDRSAEKSSLPFNPQKQQPMPSEQQQQHRKFSGQPGGPSLTPLSYASSSTLGGSRSTESLVSFASPSLSEPGAEEHRLHLSHSLSGATSSSARAAGAEEQLKSSDPHLLDMVTSEILQQGPPVDWSDIAGLELAKATLKEEVVWPMLRPDMFGGMAAAAPRCVLLFGPRGTGRTLLGRCLASQLGAPFLQLSGSTLATKWLVEGEKILRASFLVARCRQPSVLFISEVDMLLSAQLSEESPVNRLKAELLAQLDALHLGPADDNNSQVLVVCSTSRPQDMDEGMSRYFGRRVLVPLPDSAARHHIVSQLLSQSQHKYCLSEEELALLVRRTEGFSGLDVARLCQDALVGMLHASAQGMDLVGIMPGGQMRPLTYQDFDNVFCKFQPSISQKEIDTYTEWNKMFGCGQ